MRSNYIHGICICQRHTHTHTHTYRAFPQDEKALAAAAPAATYCPALLDEEKCFIRLPPDTLQNFWQFITVFGGLILHIFQASYIAGLGLLWKCADFDINGGF
jgi:hypothetical protein